MLTLSINSQSHFASPAMSPSSSPTASRPPIIFRPSAPRRSMMPHLPQMPQGCKRPKLSLQTAILPQPVSPALPLPCSADTPTSRNTLANSFRSPRPEDKKPELVARSPVIKESATLPYGIESAKDGILKNTPLTNLIRTRRQERRKDVGKARITFVDEPEVIPRPEQDGEPELTEAETASPSTKDEEMGDSSANETSDEQSQNKSLEWKRLRTQRSANEGRELRRGSASTPVSTAAPASPAPSNDSSNESTDFCPPQTPETPSPAQTRDWVWTLGNNFNNNVHNNTYSPYTPPDSGESSRRSSANTDTACPLTVPMPKHRSSAPPQIQTNAAGGSLPDTPSTATPARTALPETPVSVRGLGDEMEVDG